jgi:protein-S-isoprenylcysteine O-methyltransferase Ste14
MTRETAASKSMEISSVRGSFGSFQRSYTYDYLMRLPLLLWSMLLAMAATRGLTKYLHEAGNLSKAAYAIDVAMQLATISFLILLATTTVRRMRPSGRARGIEPRISALLGTLLPGSIILFPRYQLSATAAVVATVLILLGNTLSVFVLAQLGRSFSVMAEARQLVASGVYRYTRHPLYLAEEIATLGVYMQFMSTATTFLILGHFAFQLRRMYNEETFLSEALPDYSEYQKSTARLIPGIY